MRALLGWVVFSSVLVGCQSAPTTPPPMSVDEAKKITASFEDQGYVPPPRTTIDVTAILERTKPDVTALALRRAIADAPTPLNAAASFYYQRGQTLRYEGRIEEAIRDLSEAARLEPSGSNNLLRLADVLAQGGYLVRAGEAYANVKGSPGNVFFATINLAGIHDALGDSAQADRDLDNARRQYQNLSNSSYHLAYRSRMEAEQGNLFKNRGDYVAAEQSYRMAMADVDWIVTHWNPAWETAPTGGTSGGAQKEVNIQRSVDMKRQIALVYRFKGLLDESEYWIRRALMQSIELLGVSAPSTISALRNMSSILTHQGRYPEALQLAEITLAKVKLDNPRPGSSVVASILGVIGSAAIAQGDHQKALDAFEELSLEMSAFPDLRERMLGMNIDFAIALRAAGRVDEALPIAQTAVEWRTRTLGPASPSTAMARGFFASFLATAGERERALAEFQAVVPQLASLSRSASAAGEVNLSRKAKGLLGDYIRLLATIRGSTLEQRVPGGVSGETFRYADVARGAAVEQALLESGVRAAITDQALADLARREQDTSYRIEAR